MKAYLANLPPKICMLLTLSAVVIAYPVVMVVLPAIIRAAEGISGAPPPQERLD